MAGELFKFILLKSVTSEFIFQWLQTGDEDKVPINVSEDLSLLPEQFICYFLNELRSQTQWLLKKEKQIDSSRQEKPMSAEKLTHDHEENSPLTPEKYSTPLKPNFNYSKEKLSSSSKSSEKKYGPRMTLLTSPTVGRSPVPEFQCLTPPSAKSIKSVDKLNSPTKSSEKKHGPRLALLTSPIDSDGSSASEFYCSTPKHTPRSAKLVNSVDCPDSPLWSPADFPATPLSNKFKSWSVGSDSHERKKHSPSSHSKSNEENRCRSQAKLSLGDFVLKELNTSKPKSRRIKPTKVTPEPVRIPTDGPFAGAGFQSLEKNEATSPDDRLKLKMECKSVSKKLASVSLSQYKSEVHHTSTSKLDSSVEENLLEMTIESAAPLSPATTEACPLAAVVPEVSHKLDPSLVINTKVLDLIAEVFSFILRENLCDNVMIELCFLMNLLVASHVGGTGGPFPPLNTIHNCAYFAVQTLTKIEDTLTLLSSTTLLLLSTSPAVSTFAPELEKQLGSWAREKLKNLKSTLGVQQDGNVSFQCDTDNLENFTSHLSFTSFRKQRDSLYQLLATWEKDHSTPGWSFHNKLSSRVRAILAIRDDPTNLVHLARLFRNQLLASCSIQSPTLDEAGEEVLELLPSADRSRLFRLQARLSGPGLRRGPVPGPEFPGRQQFFQEFIRACGPGPFSHFLQLSLVDELHRFNDAEFTLEGNDGFADELTLKKYLECVSSARLLAKFLAFAEFLPYHGSEEYSEQVVNLHSTIRQRILPLFDVERCLKDAIRNHRLVLTIPWLVSYLSLMDRGSARLPAYLGVWRLLAALRHLPPRLTSGGRLMLQLCLGWLYQVASILPAVKPCLLGDVTNERGLDDMNVVSEDVLYHVCPFLCELNAILSGNPASSGRHIRPTPTTPRHDHAQAAKQLELRLEESFLQNQSPSTRRTIQYVSERVASCCIKDIAADVLPQIKKKMKERFSQAILHDNKKIDSLFEAWEAEVRSASLAAAMQICGPRAVQSMAALLGRDVPKDATQTAAAMATRYAIEKVQSWVQSHALSESTRSETINYLEKGSEPCDDHEEGDNKPRLRHLTECVAVLRDAVWRAVHGDVSEGSLREAMSVTRDVLAFRPLPAPTERGVIGLLTELLIWSYVSCPNIPESTWLQLAELVRDVGVSRHPSTGLERVLSPRNIHLVKTDIGERRLANLPLLLVKVGLLDHQEALSQAKVCVSLPVSEFFRQVLYETIQVSEIELFSKSNV